LNVNIGILFNNTIACLCLSIVLINLLFENFVRIFGNLNFFKEHLHGAVKPSLVHCHQLEVPVPAVLDQMPGEETSHNLTVAILNVAVVASLGCLVGGQHFLSHKVANSGTNFSNGLCISKTKSS
jgi:hypothetical protein